MKKLIFILFLLSLSLFAYSQEDKGYNHLMDKGFVVELNSDYEFNYWLPAYSSCFEYTTKGLSLAKYDIDLISRYFPRINASWETSFSLDGYDNPALLFEHKRNDGLKAYYNKFKFLIGFGSLLKNASNENYYSPWQNNYKYSLNYSRETFRIGVTPRYSGLRYCDYEGNKTSLSEDSTLWQYTKFEEIDFDIDTNGKMMLLALFDLLFNGSSLGVIDSKLKTSVGPYVSWWQKPYNTRQAISAGRTSGNDNTVYYAKFYSAGAVEKWHYENNYFYFNNQLNWGLALVKLSQNTVFLDSSSLLQMQFNIIPQVGFHFPLLNHRVIFSGNALINWGFLMGVTIDDDDESWLEMASFINSDILLQASLSLTVLL